MAGGTPMARSTCDGSRESEVQAEPLETATPLISRLRILQTIENLENLKHLFPHSESYHLVAPNLTFILIKGEQENYIKVKLHAGGVVLEVILRNTGY